MPENKAPKNRVRVFKRKNLLEIRIALKKNTTALVAMIFATLAWIIALYVLVRITLHLQYFWFKAGLILSILGWFALGMAGASFFVWLFFGRERILINHEYLITDKPLVFFYRRNFYDVAGISNLRTDIEIYKANRNGSWVDETRTVIKFDTVSKLVTFARGISKEEAEFILLQLAKSSYLKKEQFAVEQKI
ncbi:MAG TPA: hypothetical protein PLX60_08240 [Chitinophagales bacterium]|nr:hypothetical protein [Chitinophagales bacterium]HPH87922.1 hypothetical protein [Chitinophagales bacterium]